ncbi:TIGR03086 family metal-binding protein [Nesterenkonia halobia]|uniref:Mycothiol-dependent maleylpyruvate isomerase metal-binding domain-containing protein n=1 Tax=Nesterenkonia halobia TaxID=37922 RepID=A0ABP6RCT5_9MICC
MSEIADRYTRLAADFRDTVDDVPSEQWQAASPCEGWTAHDVVAHVIHAHLMQLGFLDAAPEAPLPVDEDPLAALDVVVEAVAAALADPDIASRVIDGVAGPMTFAESIDGFLSFDLLIHRWDLAQAVGLTAVFDLTDVRWARGLADDLGEMLRADGVCGPARPVPAGADQQQRLLAHLGRRPE